MYSGLVAALSALPALQLAFASSSPQHHEGHPLNSDHQGGRQGTKNFIYIVPDGYGQASQTLARDYVGFLRNGGDAQHPISVEIGADDLVIGTVKTYASDNLITDSAASATAFGCGVKTFNGAIAVDDDGSPVGSILETARLAGFKTGLVVTSRITHATPACYAAHVPDRDMESIIAEQELGYSHPLGSVVDILVGGGRCYFQPQSNENSCREDDIDLLQWAEDEGWTVMTDRASFDQVLAESDVAPALPYLGLFADSHMSYELDRDPAEQPSLLETTKAALGSLKKATESSEHGERCYFIMIEASRIDHAGHANDVAGHLHETLMYNDVMQYVQEWIDSNPDTQMLSAADHECGGLTLTGFDPYGLINSQNTPDVLGDMFEDYSGDDLAGYLRNTIFPLYGITNATEADVAEVIAMRGDSDWSKVIGAVLAREVGVNWSTGSHTAADVTLHGYAAEGKIDSLKARMSNNWDNTELPLYIEEVLGLEMDDATTALRANGTEWVPTMPVEERRRRRGLDLHAHHH
ncbi:alkaline phosphatase [Lineolata rhizophorae]|uniref:Alkaline phosphatase n=1 Tax=Lineolata rhizophorae TaxID=578093 RepID=A0A6A6P5Z6_9PEZI|nr:alkaline phosphatase [Lineolata rhizophorae]